VAEQQQDLTAILDRIAHLKALEERPGTPEEAAAATAAIQRLMFRYNLDEMAVNSATRKASGAYGRIMIDIGSVSPWRRDLIAGVCQYNFAKMVYHGIMNPTVSLVGQRHNLEVVVGLYDYLQSTIERLIKEEFADMPIQIRGSFTVFSFSFGSGATNAVIDRLREQWEQSRQAENNETGLVLLDDELKVAFDDFFPNLTSVDTSMSLNYDALMAGVVAGSKINLAKQVEA
jgi:hypothetical protein